MVAHSCLMSTCSWLYCLGFCFSSLFFMTDRTFLIALRSEELPSQGLKKIWMFCSFTHLVTAFAIWRGSLSCWKRHSSSPHCYRTVGRIHSQMTFWYHSWLMTHSSGESTPLDSECWCDAGLVVPPCVLSQGKIPRWPKQTEGHLVRENQFLLVFRLWEIQIEVQYWFFSTQEESVFYVFFISVNRARTFSGCTWIWPILIGGQCDQFESTHDSESAWLLHQHFARWCHCATLDMRWSLP